MSFSRFNAKFQTRQGHLSQLIAFIFMDFIFRLYVQKYRKYLNNESNIDNVFYSSLFLLCFLPISPIFFIFCVFKGAGT